MSQSTLVRNEISDGNSSTTPLAAGATFTGTAYMGLYFSSVVVSCKTDRDGTLYIELSMDGTNWDSSMTFSVTAGLNEVHRLSVSKKFVRTRFTNTSASAQTYFRLSCLMSNFSGLLVAPFNQSIGQDADAILTKTISDDLLIAGGLLAGYSIVNKFGLNPDVDSATVPEDVWATGGVYTGWATAAETLQVVSDNAADAAAGTGARTIRVTGLDANYNEQIETITLNGVTPVNGTLTFIRVHMATIVSAGSGGANAGTIIVRQTTTTANVFLSILIGRNQSNSSAYTVPAGYTAHMRIMNAACGTAASTSIDGCIYTRAFGEPFRQRRPFFASNSFKMDYQIYGGLIFTEKSDLIIRVLSCTANNTPVNAGYDLILVKN